MLPTTLPIPPIKHFSNYYINKLLSIYIPVSISGIFGTWAELKTLEVRHNSMNGVWEFLPGAQKFRWTLLPLQGLPPSWRLPPTTHLQQISAPADQNKEEKKKNWKHKPGFLQVMGHVFVVQVMYFCFLGKSKWPQLVTEYKAGSRDSFQNIYADFSFSWQVFTATGLHPLQTIPVHHWHQMRVRKWGMESQTGSHNTHTAAQYKQARVVLR